MGLQRKQEKLNESWEDLCWLMLSYGLPESGVYSLKELVVITRLKLKWQIIYKYKIVQRK